MNKTLFMSNSVEWETPLDLFKELDLEFKFTLDPCCTNENAKCKKYYTKKENGLLKQWTNERVFCNPPYGRKIIDAWVKKSHDEFYKFGCNCIVMLLPARTDTKWFHEYIYKKAEIRFLKGRLHFSGSKYNAPFPSMIVIFKKECTK